MRKRWVLIRRRISREAILRIQHHHLDHLPSELGGSAGTWTGSSQRGHEIFLHARLSGAFRLFPHLQRISIGISLCFRAVANQTTVRATRASFFLGGVANANGDSERQDKWQTA